MVLKGSFGGASMEFSFQMPPQVLEGRLFALARLHLVAFFFFQTYDQAKRQGYWWPGAFHPILAVRKADWGNPRLKWFTDITANAATAFQGRTASGYYQVWIREMNSEVTLWAWAMEWNQNFRLIGCFGDEAAARELAKSMPALDMSVVSESGNNWVKVRVETPLVGDDTLFRMIGDELVDAQ
jgi:hypothetical protein